MENRIILGNNIRILREQKKISVSDLSKSCNYDRQAISKLEHGEQNASLNKMIDLAKYFDIYFPLLFEKDFSSQFEYSYIDEDYMEIMIDNLKDALQIRNRYYNSVYSEIGMDPTYFSKIMNQKVTPNLDTISKLAEFTNIELVSLFTKGG